MKGILYGAGVGPGDPELMTLKTVRLIRENEIIALPGAIATETVAYQIAVQAVPELACKTLIPVAMPMTHDREEMERNHDRAADTLEALLPGKPPVEIPVTDLRNGEGEPIQATPHATMAFSIPWGEALPKGTILRFTPGEEARP